MPLKKTLSLINSLWSCNRMGVLFRGVNPNAGIPFSLKNLESVAAGNISLDVFNFLQINKIDLQTKKSFLFLDFSQFGTCFQKFFPPQVRVLISACESKI